jgi:hypothetical protein
MKDMEFTMYGNTFGYYVGPLGHIRSESSCRMCRFYYEMRWSDSV